MSKKYKAIGIMSGTSLDGLDIAYCEFKKNKKWLYKIVFAETKKYNGEWKNKLKNAFKLDKRSLKHLDQEYGEFIGNKVLQFIKKHNLSVDFVASHGHTIFHEPAKKITLQIGDGTVLSSICKLPVIYDFRSGDVLLGGQGAPLVPIVDKLLFSQYKYCLNLGGIANISFTNRFGERVAFDICPVNIVLNHLSDKLGKEFDKGGKIAATGRINQKLLDKLNDLPFYKMPGPKSLGREWVEHDFFPLLNTSRISIQDKLRTVIEHIAIQIAKTVIVEPHNSRPVLFITGGGTYNLFLLKKIALYTKSICFTPKAEVIEFKEAMTFALLGLLKMRKEINILKSVTGAKQDSCGGKIAFPNQNAVSSS
jgi:anhydro-N-acetylmuramic acid kinase